MQRVAALLLVAGGILILTWAVAPAAPSPGAPIAREGAQTSTNYQQTAPLLDDVTAQVARMRERLAVLPPPPAPTRDPFRFGQRPEPRRSEQPVPTVEVAPLPPPPPVLPRVVAVLTASTEPTAARSVVLAVGDEVKVYKVGETVGTLTIVRIGADAIELQDKTSGAIHRVAIQ